MNIRLNMNTENETQKRIQEINTENIIIFIFLILIFLSLYANQLEKNFFLKHSEADKEKYYYIQIFVFFIVVIVNIYYIYLSYQEVISLTPEDSPKKRKYAHLSLIASVSALIAGLIILYIAITDTELDAEITL